MPLDLAQFTKPLDPVTFTNGRTVAVRPFGPEEWELYRSIQKDPDDAKALDLIRRVLPDATDEDLETLTALQAGVVLEHAKGKIDLVLQLLGNSVGATASPPPPSPTSPTPSTS